MPTQANLVLFKDALPIPSTIFPAALPNATAVVELKVATTSLHSDLPPTTIWGYNGTFPGPIIEVNRGQKVHIEYRNHLQRCVPLGSLVGMSPDGHTTTGPETTLQHHPVCLPAHLPMKVVTAPDDTQSEAGKSSSDPAREVDVSYIQPTTVAHLHGANTHPDSDGWTENVIMLNQSALYTYDNREKSTMFWFHDHAMGITRLNVYAGLAGLYIVRDTEEMGLHLPKGQYEVPMVLQDRNLEVDANGNLTGQLLHKVEDGTMEFFGPFNVVNGKISPFLNVRRKFYRLRMVNGSNARTYTLKLLVDDAGNTPFNTTILTQIGSDGGLLGKPTPLKNNEITLAPGERADIIADFTGIKLKGKRLNWVNCASAPYDGLPVPFSNPRTLDNDPIIINAIRQKNACVMQFRVENAAFVLPNFSMPAALSSTFVRLSHGTLPAGHNHRMIALVEEDFTDPDTMVVMTMVKLRELVPVDVAGGETIPAGEFSAKIAGVLYKSVAAMFYDPITMIIRYGAMEAWKIVNLTGDTHPFHVHLVQFQALGRQTIHEGIPSRDPTTDPTIIDNYIGASSFNLTFDQPTPTDSLLDENEKGWKDTIRINPNEMMTIAMTFEGHNGRFMYHCHLLEHEDREMMRPFVVLPDAIVDMMHMGGHHH